MTDKSVKSIKRNLRRNAVKIAGRGKKRNKLYATKRK